MKNIIKIGFMGIVISTMLSGCFDNGATKITEKYFDGFRNYNLKVISETLNDNIKDSFIEKWMLQCSTTEIRNDVVPQLITENINTNALIAYKYFPIEIQNKVLDLCTKAIKDKHIERKENLDSIKILDSKINENEAIVEVDAKYFNKAVKYEMRLQKINNEWKIAGWKSY